MKRISIFQSFQLFFLPLSRGRLGWGGVLTPTSILPHKGGGKVCPRNDGLTILFIFFIFFFTFSKSIFAARETIYGKAPEFSLTNQNAKTFASSDLKGKPWIANFIFTHCQTQCPLMTQKMKILQEKLKNSDIQFVSFSVDPETDTPAVLSEYAKKFKADERNWFFLTGNKNVIWEIAMGGFKIGVANATREDLLEGAQPILHSEKFVLIDRNANILGYYDSTEPEKLDELSRDAMQLIHQDPKAWIKKLPALNAGLNATSALLIILGLILIRQHAWTGHAICMCFAMVVSTLFLASYLYYHFHVGHVPFPHQGPIRVFYFVILISHTILAVLVPPLAISTLYQALRSRFQKHVRIAKVTFPVWLYVSITGVLVYYMLYKM